MEAKIIVDLVHESFFWFRLGNENQYDTVKWSRQQEMF